MLRNKKYFNIDEETINKQFKNGIEDPKLFLLSMATLIVTCIDDLQVKILIRNTEFDFITSDSPVFQYNKYCEGIKGIKATGFIAEGEIIFAPLSPEVCLIFFDKSVYKVGKNQESVIEIPSENDMEQINAIQFISSDSNLYFSNLRSIPHIKHIRDKYINLRALYEPRIIELQQDKDPRKTMLINYVRVPNINLNLSFLSIRREARKIKLNERIRRYRKIQPELPDEIKKISNVPEEDRGKIFYKVTEI